MSMGTGKRGATRSTKALAKSTHAKSGASAKGISPSAKEMKAAGNQIMQIKVLYRKAKTGDDSRRGARKTQRVMLRTYSPEMGVDEYVDEIASATPLEIVEIERSGVPGRFIKDLSKRMQISSTRIFKILGLPKATVEKKVASGKMVAGSSGQAAIGMARLIALAKELAANSTAAEAREFDAARWLGEWIERPQPSLGGRRPADLLDTPTGLEVVTRLLGAAESGAYQ